MSAVAEFFACLGSGFIANRFGPQRTLMVFFLVSGLVAFLMAITPPDMTNLILVLLLILKFGVSTTASLCYVMTPNYFPKKNTS